MKKPVIIASEKACLHCGSNYNYLFCHGNARPDGTPLHLAYQVMCYKCRASGPIARTAREAIAAWEHRARLRLVEPPPRHPAMIEFEDFEEEGRSSAAV